MEYLSEIWVWIRKNEELVWMLGIISLVSFLAILLVVPVLVVRLPADYFLHQNNPKKKKSELGIFGWFVRICKNLLGIILVIAGFAMLFLPGQGVLTILVGLMVTDFPGKHSLERWIVSRPNVGQAINWVRKNAGKPPFQLPSRQPDG